MRLPLAGLFERQANLDCASCGRPHARDAAHITERARGGIGNAPCTCPCCTRPNGPWVEWARLKIPELVSRDGLVDEGDLHRWVQRRLAEKERAERERARLDERIDDVIADAKAGSVSTSPDADDADINALLQTNASEVEEVSPIGDKSGEAEPDGHSDTSPEVSGVPAGTPAQSAVGEDEPTDAPARRSRLPWRPKPPERATEPDTAPSDTPVAAPAPRAGTMRFHGATSPAPDEPVRLDDNDAVANWLQLAKSPDPPRKRGIAGVPDWYDDNR